VLVSRRERDVGGGWECVGRKWWMEEKAKDVTFEQNIKERVGPTSGRPAPHLRQARSARLMGKQIHFRRVLCRLPSHCR